MNSQFLEPNMAISLLWGWTFIIGAGFGIAARMVPEYRTFFTVIRYSLMLPAFIFTNAYQKGAQERQFADIDRRMARQRGWAYIGLAAAALMFLAIGVYMPNAGCESPCRPRLQEAPPEISPRRRLPRRILPLQSLRCDPFFGFRSTLDMRLKLS